MSSPLSVVLDPPRLEKSRADRLVSQGRIVAGAGIAVCALAGLVAPERFAHAYLVGFLFALTLSLGGLFFVIVQHLTRAGWSVTVRRQAEWLASFLPWCALLFVPVLLLRHRLYEEWMGPEAMRDELMHQKTFFLTQPFFFVRAVIYFVVWGLLARYFVRRSHDQDESGDPELTRKMRAFSGPATLLFALSISFAGFDWLMSMQPRWYSTIFGVYVFSGAAVSSYAALALMLLAIRRGGLLKAVSTIEHRHDVGKFLFGFTVFYAYISFSQYFLIWYANIPEETIFYSARWVGSWRAASLLLVFTRFPIPFLLLLSRSSKRSPAILAVASAVVLFAQYLDLYWLVMPHASPDSAAPSLVDLAALAGPVGALLGFLAWQAARGPLYPQRDPLLPEAVRLEVL